jgi:hypothetical protein
MFKKIENSVAGANSCCAMEPETISKNGASLKSHTSRVLFCLSVCIILLLASCSSEKIYTKPNVTAYVIKHKTLAILPTTMNIIQGKDSHNVNADVFSKAKSFQMQEDIASAFYEFNQKGKMHIEIQDVEKTNSILKQINYFEDNTTSISSKELAEILGVDALLLTNCQRKAGVVMKLYDGETGELLWNCNKKSMNTGKMFKKAGKKMPYYGK